MPWETTLSGLNLHQRLVASKNSFQLRLETAPRECSYHDQDQNASSSMRLQLQATERGQGRVAIHWRTRT
jgi:hypothetical protein